MRSISLYIANLGLANLAAVLVLSTGLQATTLQRLTMNDMTDKCHVVVRATVLNGAAEYTNGIVLTHYQLSVSEVWKGSAGSMIDVYVPGGRAGGFRELVPGAPALDTGSEYVIFLWIGPSGRAQIIGLSQGLFNVTRDTAGTMMLERPGARETMIDPVTGNPVTDQAVRMKAADVKALVRKRLQ